VTIPPSSLRPAVRTGFVRPRPRAAGGNCSSPPTLPQLLVKQVNVVGDAALVEELVELLIVDAMRSLDFAIQVWCAWPDLQVANVE